MFVFFFFFFFFQAEDGIRDWSVTGVQTCALPIYARFRRPVTPGDALHLHVTKTQSRANVWKFKGEAKVDGKVCAEATFSAMITDRKSVV